MSDYRRGTDSGGTGIARQIAAENRAAKCKTCKRAKCVCDPKDTQP